MVDIDETRVLIKGLNTYEDAQHSSYLLTPNNQIEWRATQSDRQDTSVTYRVISAKFGIICSAYRSNVNQESHVRMSKFTQASLLVGADKEMSPYSLCSEAGKNFDNMGSKINQISWIKSLTNYLL